MLYTADAQPTSDCDLIVTLTDSEPPSAIRIRFLTNTMRGTMLTCTVCHDMCIETRHALNRILYSSGADVHVCCPSARMDPGFLQLAYSRIKCVWDGAQVQMPVSKDVPVDPLGNERPIEVIHGPVTMLS
jgi:hypothetical protein